jgi:hypothetical protein
MTAPEDCGIVGIPAQQRNLAQIATRKTHRQIVKYAVVMETFQND